MGTSLGFHIVFAVLGVGLPLLMSTAEGLALWRHDDAWMQLARRWSKAFGILFAVGAVSGTVLAIGLILAFLATILAVHTAIALAARARDPAPLASNQQREITGWIVLLIVLLVLWLDIHQW